MTKDQHHHEEQAMLVVMLKNQMLAYQVGLRLGVQPQCRLMLAAPHMLPNVLNLLLGQWLEQVIFSASTYALKHCVWMLVC